MTDARCVVCKLPIRYVPKWKMWVHEYRANDGRVWTGKRWEVIAGNHNHEARPGEREGVT